jgi:hypothetical protein
VSVSAVASDRRWLRSGAAVAPLALALAGFVSAALVQRRVGPWSAPSAPLLKSVTSGSK